MLSVRSNLFLSDDESPLYCTFSSVFKEGSSESLMFDIQRYFVKTLLALRATRITQHTLRKNVVGS